MSMWHRANIEAPDDQAIAEFNDRRITTDCCQRRVWEGETFLVDKHFNWCEQCWLKEFGPLDINER